MDDSGIIMHDSISYVMYTHNENMERKKIARRYKSTASCILSIHYFEYIKVQSI